jgi:recombination protein RecT
MADLQALQEGAPKRRSITELKKLPPGKMVEAFLEDNKAMIAKALPRHVSADRMLVVAQTAVTQTPGLLKCSPESLFGALIKCTQAGLEPNNALGECWLIPYGKDVQFQFGYPGQLKMIRNTGLIGAITPRVVRENDEFSYEYGLNEHCVHRPAMVDAGKMTHVYLVAHYKDSAGAGGAVGTQSHSGSKEFWVWTREQMEAHRDKYVKAKRGPWYDSEYEFEQMCLKTTINLASKWLPRSLEMQELVTQDLRGDMGKSQGWEKVITGDFKVSDEDPLAGIIEHDIEPENVVDAAGEILDPVVHLVTDSGKPVFNADDTFRKRPQRGKNAEPTSEDASQAAGESQGDPATTAPPTEPDPEQQAADEADARRGAGGEEAQAESEAAAAAADDEGISME